MPLRTETESQDIQGRKVVITISKDCGFKVGPGEAINILGLPRTTLFRYDGPDVIRRPSKRSHEEQEREYSDQALLRIAMASKRVDISRDSETGNVCFVASRCKTILGIDWNEIALYLEDNFIYI